MRAEQRALADGGKPAAEHVSRGALREIRRRPQGRARSVRGRGDGGIGPGHFRPQADHLRGTRRLEGLNFDLIITLSPEAHHKALELTHRLAADVEYWPTHDPTGAEGNREQKLEAYREVCDTLSMRIRKRFSKVAAASG
jgi:hypothetical protein